MKKTFSSEDLANTKLASAARQPFATLSSVLRRAVALGAEAFMDIIELTDAENDERYHNFIEGLGLENSLYFETMVSEDAEKSDIVAAREHFFEALNPRKTVDLLNDFFSSIAKEEQVAA